MFGVQVEKVVNIKMNYRLLLATAVAGVIYVVIDKLKIHGLEVRRDLMR